MTFTPVLTDAFKHADEDLLAWMHGEVGLGPKAAARVPWQPWLASMLSPCASAWLRSPFMCPMGMLSMRLPCSQRTR